MKKNLIFLLKIIVISVALSLILPRICIVQGPSMEPTIHNKQVLLATAPFHITRGDIVIVKYSDKIIIKRVVGIPGDTIHIHDGQVYVNGNVADNFKTEYAGLAESPLVLGDDEYFILGDNRSNSLDSRFSEIGIVTRKQIKKEVIFSK